MSRTIRTLVATSCLAVVALTGCGAGETSSGGTPATSQPVEKAAEQVAAGGWVVALAADRTLTVTSPDGTTRTFDQVLAGGHLKDVTDDGRVVTVLDGNGVTMHMLDTSTGVWRTANGIGGPGAPVATP